MMAAWWLALHYFGSVKRFFNMSITLCILGLAIGVGSLVVSMAVFSGYMVTLEKSVQDAFGHLVVVKRSSEAVSDFESDLEKLIPDILYKTPFVYSEAILAHKGKITGVLIEGVEEPTVHQVLNLKARLHQGELGFLNQAQVNDDKNDTDGPVMIGKAIADRFQINVGDTIRIVVPLATEFQASSFRPKLGSFKVTGILNYGRHDFDSRYMVMPLAQVQRFVELGQRITGYRLRLTDPLRAQAISREFAARGQAKFWVRDWFDVNRNLFEAVRLEKAVLFFVLMILVVAGSFNVANTLFVSVVQRYRDISVLKTLGASDFLVRQIFVAQGLIVGLVGALAGIGLGLFLCQVFEWAQTQYAIVPKEVYKLDYIKLEVQFTDLVVILVSCLLLCFIATIVPSRRSTKISPVEGLRYE